MPVINYNNGLFNLRKKFGQLRPELTKFLGGDSWHERHELLARASHRAAEALALLGQMGKYYLHPNL